MESERKELADKLIKYIKDCELELDRDMILKIDGSKDYFLAQALLSLYHYGIEHTNAVAVCVTNGYATAARTCMRGLVELTLEIRLMLENGDPRENAVKYLTYGSLELIKTLKKNDDKSPNIEEIEKNLQEYRKVFPDIVVDLENKFNSKKGLKHWSGLSYKERLSNIKGATFSGLDNIYGILSWDTHSRMAAFTTKFEITGQKLNLKTVEEEDITFFERIVDSAGIIFHSLSNAIFYCPIVFEKASGKNLIRPE